MIPRFLLTADQVRGGRAYLDPSQSRHAARVLRLSAGSRLVLVSSEGEEYEGQIESASPRAVVAALLRRLPARVETLPRVTLVQALIKGERMDWLVQKAAELGVARFIPLASLRAVVRLDGERAEGRRERWQKMANQAAQQSRAARAMQVEAVASLGEAIARVRGSGLLLIPHEGEEARSLRQALGKRPRPASAAIFVGPEGGFAPEEIEELRSKGGLTVSLGARVLRAETAAIVASTLVLYELTAGAARGGR